MKIFLCINLLCFHLSVNSETDIYLVPRKPWIINPGAFLWGSLSQERKLLQAFMLEILQGQHGPRFTPADILKEHVKSGKLFHQD